MSQQLPVVSFLVSGHSRGSRSSVHIGAYLGGCMAVRGNADVRIISLPPGGDSDKPPPPLNQPPSPLTVTCFGGKHQVKDHFHMYSPVETLHESDMIVVCTDATDTSRTVSLIHDCNKKRSKDDPPVGVISLQKGVKNSGPFHERFESVEEVLFLEGALGLDVVRDPADGALSPLSSDGCMVVERLSKDKASLGVPMVDLLESTGVKVLSRKHLTTHTWGIVSFGCLAATNALVGGTMRDHLSCHYTRRVAAHMLRDCRLALEKASQDGKWEPDLASCCRLPLSQLEVLLCLPGFLYYVLRPLCLRLHRLPGPMQLDLHDNLDTDVGWTLKEVEKTAKAFGAKTPTLSAVINMIEQTAHKKEGVQLIKPQELYRSLGNLTAGLKHALYVVSKLLSIIIVLAFVIMLIW